jgi:hypothetical protein
VGTMVTSAVNARRLRGLALGATLCICRCLVGGTARTALVIKQQLAIATVSEPELWPAVQTSSDTPPPVTHPGYCSQHTCNTARQTDGFSGCRGRRAAR